jgi:signal transduction histidine kinase
MPPDDPQFGDILTSIQKIVPFDAASLYLRGEEANNLRIAACLGRTVAIPDFLVTSSTGADGFSLNPKAALIRTDSDRELLDQETDWDVVMYLPLIIDGVATGALMLGAIGEKTLNEQHLKLTTVLADQLAISIERINHIAAIESRNEELRLAQAELRANQKKIVAAEKLAAAARLAASVNHQINNPLAVILGHVQCLLVEQRNLSRKAMNRLDRIQQAVNKIAGVNRGLLRIEYPDLPALRAEDLQELVPESTD